MIGIVVVCYNRTDGMRRILSSLSKACHNGDEVALVISIDKGQIQDELIGIANDFIWEHGQKVVRAFDERQGLRKHIIACGDLTSEYESVVVLEDDLIVAEGFYDYVKQAMDFYGDSDAISGVSLYKHMTNPGSGRPFEPQKNGYDTFLFQFAQSWGQSWNKRMWESFKKWYLEHEGNLESDGIIPEYVARWNDKSWLKYYIKYTAEMGKYFVYPYTSLSTNNSDIGEHCIYPNNDFQVSMLEGTLTYKFPSVDEAIKYDAFFERIFENGVLDNVGGKAIIDLYGLKHSFNDADFLFSTQRLNYRIVKQIALKYRPQEINCVYPTEGKGIFLYDLHKSCRNKYRNQYAVVRYDVKAIRWKKTLIHAIQGIRMSILSRIKRS